VRLIFKLNGDSQVDILDADNYFEHIGSVKILRDRVPLAEPLAERAIWRWRVEAEAPGGNSGGGYLFVEPMRSR
jgi:hypothetical protein